MPTSLTSVIVFQGRKVVLATAIAETSLTLPDIRALVDAGRARRARFDPNSGMSRLVTERVTRAEAEQRRGRAGRVAEGVCYRMWTKGEEGGLAPFPPAEIEAADLAPLALELALWGDAGLPFLTPPNPGGMAEAQALLTGLGALDKGRITAHGRALAALPLHPRLGHMLLKAGPAAATLAALMAERDPLRGAPPDLAVEYIQADTWVRFQRMQGHQVHFVGADDAHGAPIMIAAEKAGITPQQFVANIAAGRKPYLDGFHIAFDNWHSTDAPENHELAQQIFNVLERAITGYYPNTTDIVLVGGDAIIPFYRVPDETQYANESLYGAGLNNAGALRAGSALDGALFRRFIQTDNFYADREPTPWRGRAL